MTENDQKFLTVILNGQTCVVAFLMTALFWYVVATIVSVSVLFVPDRLPLLYSLLQPYWGLLSFFGMTPIALTILTWRLSYSILALFERRYLDKHIK